jgi:secreted trypsin-like serine protease
MILPLHGALFICSLLVHQSLAKDRRVQGGADTTIEEYPFIVSIRYPSKSHKCGGSLISREWVLTAAHCVQKDVGSIQYGSTRIDRNGKNVVGVEKIIYHERFNVEGRLENDIAVIKLSRPVELNGEVGIVKLPSPFQRTSNEYPATIVGWGTNVTKGFLQNTLQKLTYKIVSCADVKHPYVTGTNICAKEFGEEKGQCHVSSKTNVPTD